MDYVTAYQDRTNKSINHCDAENKKNEGSVLKRLREKKEKTRM